MIRKIVLTIFSLLSKLKYRLFKCKYLIRISPSVRISKTSGLNIDGKIRIQRSCFVSISGGGQLFLRDGVDIGPFSQINVNHYVELGDNVLLAPNVFISDHNHEYRDISKAISLQGMKEQNATVKIGRDSWIATNVVIVGNVIIGEHCVIGANSVVINNIPSYSVAVGNPAKVVKKYNFESGIWEKINYAN